MAMMPAPCRRAAARRRAADRSGRVADSRRASGRAGGAGRRRHGNDHDARFDHEAARRHAHDAWIVALELDQRSSRRWPGGGHEQDVAVARRRSRGSRIAAMSRAGHEGNRAAADRSAAAPPVRTIASSSSVPSRNAAGCATAARQQQATRRRRTRRIASIAVAPAASPSTPSAAIDRTDSVRAR